MFDAEQYDYRMCDRNQTERRAHMLPQSEQEQRRVSWRVANWSPGHTAGWINASFLELQARHRHGEISLSEVWDELRRRQRARARDG